MYSFHSSFLVTCGFFSSSASLAKSGTMYDDAIALRSSRGNRRTASSWFVIDSGTGFGIPFSLALAMQAETVLREMWRIEATSLCENPPLLASLRISL